MNGADTAFAPGRVNLIGDHVDYVGGRALPMAIQLGTTVTLAGRGGTRIRLSSDAVPGALDVAIDADPATVDPPWGRHVVAVLRELAISAGGTGTVTTSLPVGAGLSSSAALEVAVALAFGTDLTGLDLALACHRAEAAATGVPTGILDQLTITSACDGAALLVDCRDLSTRAVRLPDGLAIHAVHCGESRSLTGSAYASRRTACEDIEREIGPLRDATMDDIASLADRGRRRRARHVVSEIARVGDFTDAMDAGDLDAMGHLADESHRSLRDDYEVSSVALDAAVERARRVPGVIGARLTGAGFGGCIVVFAHRDVDPAEIGGWRLDASGPARRIPPAR
ncbi:MAG: galactokinase family protein [Acidimicrobiales bacterium]